MADLPRLIDAELELQMTAALSWVSISESTRESLLNYFCHGIPCGSFLTAVLENDLYKSVVRADDANRSALVELVSYLVNCAPIMAWGSPDAVREWIARGVAARAAAELERELTGDEAAQALGTFVAGKGGAA